MRPGVLRPSYLAGNRPPDAAGSPVTCSAWVILRSPSRRKGRPLLVAVTLGAKFSMPGMGTVLNIGLNDASCIGLAAEASSSDRASPGLLPPVIPMFGKTVSTSRASWTPGPRQGQGRQEGLDDVDLDVRLGWPSCSRDLEHRPRRDRPRLPAAPAEICRTSTGGRAVFRSWNTDRATAPGEIPTTRHRRERIAPWCSGNLGRTTPRYRRGVAIRDPASGKPGAYGDCLVSARGEDVVAGILAAARSTTSRTIDASATRQFTMMRRLGPTYHRTCATSVHRRARRKLWMLQDPRRQTDRRHGVPHH